MELLKRNKKNESDNKQYKTAGIVLLVVFLVLFTNNIKVQYIVFEFKSMITQKSFEIKNNKSVMLSKQTLALNEGNIIKDPQSSLFQEYIIEFAQGTAIKENDYVLKDGGLLGVVKKVNKNFAVVIDVSRSKNIIKGMIPKTREIITLEGRGDGDYFSATPRDYEIEVGDKISWIRDQNVLLGEVVDIQFDSRDIYKKVYIRSYINNAALEKVLLVSEQNVF